eukprot:699441-Ditylum_brightwellii.AAC.1
MGGYCFFEEIKDYSLQVNLEQKQQSLGTEIHMVICIYNIQKMSSPNGTNTAGTNGDAAAFHKDFNSQEGGNRVGTSMQKGGRKQKGRNDNTTNTKEESNKR